MSAAKFFRCAVFSLVVVLFSISGVFSNTYPPKPSAHFFGDANGDTGVTGADIVQHYNYILSKAYTYDTLQPNNSVQAWNTCDVDGNRGCTGGDTVILNSFLLSKSVSVADDPWSVNNINLPFTVQSAAMWIPFNIDLHGTHATLGASGRPGVSVVVEIDPVLSTTTGQLSGRECNPVAGTRDQLTAANAQCALAVTVTDWPTSTGTGPTESGVYGLQVMADGSGDLNLKVYTVAIPGLDMPATSTRLIANFYYDYFPTADIDCSNPGPNPVNEGQLIECTVTGDFGTPVIDGGVDTCGGALVGGIYSYTPGEGGARTCVAAVINDTATDSDTVTINDVNLQPTIVVTCPGNVIEPEPINCTIVVDDNDVPADTLTCSLGAGDTCGGTLMGCTNYVLASSAGKSPSCVVEVVVNDNAGQPNSTAYDSPVVLLPVDFISLNCPPSAEENASFSCTFNSGGGSPCMIGAGTTCTGATLTNCTQIDFTAQGEAAGPGSCTVQVVKGAVTDSKSVTINEVNQIPVITSTCSGSASEGTAYSCSLTATDADIPAQSLTWSKAASDTCGGTVSGSTYNWMPSENQGGTQCVVGVQVADSFAPPGTATQNTTVTVIEDCHQPIITSTCSSNASEGIAYSCSLTATDGEIPFRPMTWVVLPGDSCGGTLTGPQYNWTPIETQGGSNCMLSVQVSNGCATANYNVTVSVVETNVNPVITSTCSGTAYEGLLYSCNLTATDADLPVQTLTWSKLGTDTCGGTITGSTYSWTPPEYQGGTNCTLAVRVADNFSTPGTADYTRTVNVIEEECYPIITSTCSTSASEGIVYTCSLTATDCDLPAQPLTWTTTAANTCGGNIVGTTYIWTPTETQGGTQCVVGVQVADNYMPPGTDTQNTTVTVAETNVNPVITSTCPTTAPESGCGGGTYTCNLTATDADNPAQTLTWTTTALDTCGGTITGSTYSYSPSESQGWNTCVVGIQVADNWTPSGTATQNTNLTITETNCNPVITSTCSPTAPESGCGGGTYTCNLTATDTDLPSQTLTWSKLGTDTCGGTVSPTSNPGTYTWTPTESQGGTTCTLAVRVADNFTVPGTADYSITITVAESNCSPTWTAAPTPINIGGSMTYNQVNGVAADADLPNTSPTDPGYISCAKTAQTCSFTVTVTNSGTHQGTIGCNLSFTAPPYFECCTVTVQGYDGWTPSGTVSSVIPICTAGPESYVTGVSVSGTLGGIDPTIARIKNNYPADWGQFTINFGLSPGATCGATVNCGGAVTVTGTPIGNNCIVTATAGYWPSASTCTISAITTSSVCNNCAAYTNTFNTSLRTSECATRGGTCGGFIDTTQYGTGDGLNVYLIDMKSITGAYVIPATNYVYVLVEHPAQVPPRRIETFDGNRDGLVTVTSASTPALLSEPVKITASYKGGSGMCEVNSNENIVCYRFVTMSDIDSRRVNLPMELTTVGDWALPEAQLWLYTPIANFSTYVGGTPANNSFPNPIRAGFAVLSLIDQGMSSINLDDLLRPTGESSTLSLCFGSLGLNVGGIDLPGNLLLPDVIRQDWNAACSGSWKMSPALTTYRIFTNRPSMTRRVIVMGASVVTTLFDLYKVSLDLTALPITMTALGTSTINIGAIAADLNIGDVAGAWGTTTALYPTPHSVPFEFDYRSTTAAYPVTLHEANPPYDPARVALGTAATPDYGDPNRSGAANHSGQMYVYGENLLISGVRAGAAGLIPFQLVMTPKIDDSVFTVFQRHNTNSKSFNDQEPWGTASTNSRVVSATMRGLPSTTVDADIPWATANVGLVGIMMRGFCESAYPGVASSGIDLPGSSANSNLFGGLETIQGSTRGTHSWLPIPTMSSPANDGMRVPPQSELVARAWPVNRNGQLMRGTATIASHSIQTALGARYFTLSNPLVNTSATRRADMYYFDIKDTRHIANPFYDAVRHYPDNTLWRMYGNINGQSSLTVTLPYIFSRRVTLTGVYGVVPDPWEAGNFTNLSMDWNLTELIIDSGTRGMNRAWNYQNMSITWLYEMSYLSSSEAAQFIWH